MKTKTHSVRISFARETSTLRLYARGKLQVPIEDVKVKVDHEGPMKGGSFVDLEEQLEIPNSLDDLPALNEIIESLTDRLERMSRYLCGTADLEDLRELGKAYGVSVEL